MNDRTPQLRRNGVVLGALLVGSGAEGVYSALVSGGLGKEGGGSSLIGDRGKEEESRSRRSTA